MYMWRAGVKSTCIVYVDRQFRAAVDYHTKHIRKNNRMIERVVYIHSYRTHIQVYQYTIGDFL